MYKVGIVTISDKGAKGQREDISGVKIRELLEETGYEICSYVVIPDEQDQIERTLIHMADVLSCDLILTTGGTGFSKRDVTPEATIAVAHRIAPGIAEAIRNFSMGITKRAMLSRGVSVLRGETLIVNLPGSPKAVCESLSYILDTLPHGLAILKGTASECAR